MAKSSIAGLETKEGLIRLDSDQSPQPPRHGPQEVHSSALLDGHDELCDIHC